MRAPTTPPSLKWLIRLRARTAGEIERIEQAEQQRQLRVNGEITRLQTQLCQMQDEATFTTRVYKETLLSLRSELAATDAVLSKHEIVIDPRIIAPVRPHINDAVGEHGEMTRYILEALRKRRPSATTTEVVAYVSIRLGLDLDDSKMQELRLNVRRRMRTLVSEARVRRLHATTSNLEGRWTLPD